MRLSIAHLILSLSAVAAAPAGVRRTETTDATELEAELATVKELEAETEQLITELERTDGTLDGSVVTPQVESYPYVENHCPEYDMMPCTDTQQLVWVKDENGCDKPECADDTSGTVSTTAEEPIVAPQIEPYPYEEGHPCPEYAMTDPPCPENQSLTWFKDEYNCDTPTCVDDNTVSDGTTDPTNEVIAIENPCPMHVTVACEPNYFMAYTKSSDGCVVPSGCEECPAVTTCDVKTQEAVETVNNDGCKVVRCIEIQTICTEDMLICQDGTTTYSRDPNNGCQWDGKCPTSTANCQTPTCPDGESLVSEACAFNEDGSCDKCIGICEPAPEPEPEPEPILTKKGRGKGGDTTTTTTTTTDGTGDGTTDSTTGNIDTEITVTKQGGKKKGKKRNLRAAA